MITVAAVRTRAASTLDRAWRTWAVDPVAAADARLVVALHPPTEQQAMTSFHDVVAWRDEWARIAHDSGVDVERVRRVWTRMGGQEVPARVRLEGATAIAAFAGPSALRRWRLAEQRTAAALSRIGQDAREAVRANLTALAGYPEHEFEDVLAVAAFLAQHEVAMMRPRQLPIRGVDSKWFARHRAVVTDLALAGSGRDALGIVDDEPLFRVRMLGASREVAVPTSFAATVRELASLEVRPSRILVVENLESLLSLPDDLPCLAVHGAGFAAAELAAIPWLSAAPVHYWGDLDTHGFAILHRFRSAVPQARSVLMDRHTLLRNRDLWVREPKPAVGSYSTLTPDEAAVLDLLRAEGCPRLEQERLPWGEALDELRAAMSPSRAPGTPSPG